MKKIYFLGACLLTQMAFSQYMIVGKDSISAKDFARDNEYSLKNNGIEKSLKSSQEFLLLQQFAAEKKADTAAFFKDRMVQTMGELRKERFYPSALTNSLLTEYVQANQLERKMLFFIVEKKDGDVNDYQNIYQEVKSGKLSMEEAIKKYTTQEPNPVYVKPGVMDQGVFDDLVKASNGSFSRLVNTSGYVAFAKLIDTRPSLGYVIFGTVSYPNNADAEQTKTKIYQALKEGKKFEAVAAEFGSTDQEKKNGGVIMGSPTLPDEVYAEFKKLKSGQYIPQPILIEDKYYIFNVYQMFPYQLDADKKEFFLREMMNSNYAQKLQDQFVNQLMATSTFKMGKENSELSKSYQAFLKQTNPNTVLATYGKNQLKLEEFQKELKEFPNIEKVGPQEWKELYDARIRHFVLTSYSKDFDFQPENAQKIKEAKKMLYSEYVFSHYLKNQIDKNPQKLADYYNKNKSKFMWDERADGRVAILLDDSMASEIQKQIKDKSNWEKLKAKYYGKLNAKNQILIHFEEGKMVKDADIFVNNKLPFSAGVNTTKIGDKTVVVAVDSIVPPTQMTKEEADEMIRDAVFEEELQQTIAQQKAKTKIVVEPSFLKELEKNFKK